MQTRNDYIFDIETYPNVFTMAVESVRSGKELVFEISERKNDLLKVLLFLDRLKGTDARMVGFNNVGFDYPVLHYMATKLKNHTDAGYITEKIYEKAQEIISADEFSKFRHIIWASDCIVPQVDLYKIHHFDNKARATSLKVLEFNMRMENIQELPFKVGTFLTPEQIDVLIEYNRHDRKATRLFYEKTLDMIQFREELSKRFDRDFINFSDAKVGSEYFIEKLGRDNCFIKTDEGRKPRQTKRDKIVLNDVIFDYVSFDTPQFNAVKDWISQQVIKETKGVFTELDEEGLGELRQYANLKKTKGMVKNLNCIIDGVQVDFGTGGIHASIESARVFSDDEYVIIDLDVASYYPNLGIKNRIYPAHFSEKFCDIYEELYHERSQYEKGTMLNLAIKLALNAAFGNSNNKHSCFFDPQYTMSITINGQLLLCMLYEGLREIEGCQLIQMNTDGVTVRLPRRGLGELNSVCSWWQLMTGLELEQVEYKAMFIQNVNNYVAVSAKGKIKTKGAYVSDVGWHQDHSTIVVAKAAQEHLVNGVDLEDYIRNYEDDYHFLLRTKVPRTSRLVCDWGFEEELQQNVCRYFIANQGPQLVKIMPPLAKAKDPTKERRISIAAGYPVVVCNKFEGVDRNQLNVEWYVEQAKKLTNF